MSESFPYFEKFGLEAPRLRKTIPSKAFLTLRKIKTLTSRRIPENENKLNHQNKLDHVMFVRGFK